MEKFVGDTGHADTFTGITEGLTATDEQHIVVGVAGHRSLIRRFERRTEVLAEVHSEIRQVLHHYHIVLRSQFADSLQFLLAQTDPRRVVGIAIHDGADVALGKITLQFGTQFVTTIVVNIERLVFHAHHLQLHLLHGEARIDEEHGVFLAVGLTACQERGEGALHGTAHRHTALRRDIHADEGLHEARSLLFQSGITLNVGIGMGDALLQCLHLCLHTSLGSGQTGYSHFHLDELLAGSLLGLGCHLFHFTDGSLGKVGNAQFSDKLVNDLLVNRCFLHALSNYF